MQDDKKGVTIRQPATANLMVDSVDRSNVYPNPFDFQITKLNSIMNGFFTRIGTTEVVLEWNTPNGGYLNELSTVINGGASTVQVQFNPAQFYTAEEAIGLITSTISTAGGDVVWNSNEGRVLSSITNSAFNFEGDVSSANKLGIGAPLVALGAHTVVAPDLRPFRYLDFVSQQLTYNQDLKDNATNTINKDVLCRWYMAWDDPTTYDALGFPILQGYSPFVERRLFNPPKQIKWEPNMPLGNLSFQVYGDNNASPIELNPFGLKSQWLMTLQVSEN